MLRSRDRRERLQQPEIHFDLRLHRHRFAVLLTRAELPLLDGFDGFLIQSQTQRAK